MFQRSSLLPAVAVLLAMAATDASAAACRDAKGHFIACPAPAAKAAPSERCRSASGAFASCSASAAPKTAMKASQGQAVAPAVTTAGVNAAAVAPGAVTARCKDGSLSHSLHRSGSCSGHGGVAAWM